MGNADMKTLRTLVIAAAIAAASFLAAPAGAQNQPVGGTFNTKDILDAGNKFFGDVSQGLAAVVERAVSQYGLPNGYILGTEGSAAFIVGARYGEGTLYTRNAGQHHLYWQGPSLGVDFGGNGDRVMMLIYNLPSVPAIYDRFPGVSGSAHFIAGFAMNVVARDQVTIVPIMTGVGARLGLNLGYLKFTDYPTLNPL
jgi:hypothetical protein